jgi:TolB protein
MSPSGSGERIVTNGWQDEAPSWAPSGKALVFQRTSQASSLAGIYTVTLTGDEPRRVTIPQPGSDPDWSGVWE